MSCIDDNEGILISLLVLIAILFAPYPSFSQLSSPLNVNQQFVTYQRQSNFIHEFNLPSSIDQHGLKGITTDSQGNPWFYHQTNKTSTIMKFNLTNNKFNSYSVEGKTVTDNPVINLAGGQLIYDEKRNNIWFTDARINALGSFDIQSGKIVLYGIPTNNSGIMGVILSPDNKTIWFTEIIGNKIGSLDIESNSMVEFPTGDLTGPTLLAFDSRGELWVTMSYSNSVLKVEPWLLVPGSKASGMSEVKLKKPDTFSAFGIGITQNNDNTSRIFLSDHGLSRVIVSNLTSELNNYTSYWTSPSQAYPASLPSQVISDKFGNIYFPQHGGNRISKISAETGLMTESEIPTGPLATVVYLAVSPDAANTRVVPIDTKTQSNNPSPLVLKINQTIPLDVIVIRGNNSQQLLSLNQIELSVVGMTDAGLQGLTYVANLNGTSMMNAIINLNLDVKEAIVGKYTVMERISTLERDNLTVSLLYPQSITVDVPIHKSQLQNFPTLVNDQASNTPLLLRDLARYASIGVAVTLIAYLVYRKIRQRRERRNMAGENTP